MNEEHMVQAFLEEDIALPDRDRSLEFEVHEIGGVLIRSGAIAAADPLVTPDMKPFSTKVPQGRFPVEVAVAKFDSDQRIAFARVVFGPEQPSEWRMAVKEGQDPSRLSEGEYFGYPVDAGIGCFMDPEAGHLLGSRMDRQENYYEELIEEMKKVYVHTRDWASVRPDDDSELNVVMFSSGWGDGFYPSYFGISSSGSVVSLVTDFHVVYDQDDLDAEEAVESEEVASEGGLAKSWWQFWR